MDLDVAIRSDIDEIYEYELEGAARVMGMDTFSSASASVQRCGWKDAPDADDPTSVPTTDEYYFHDLS